MIWKASGMSEHQGGASANAALIHQWQSVVGAEHVLTDPEVIISYVTDWTGRYHGDAIAVVRPGTVDEVAQVVRLCSAAGISVVPQGGNTGLVGGSIPAADSHSLVLSLTRMNSLGNVDAVTGRVSCGADQKMNRHNLKNCWQKKVLKLKNCKK